MKRLLDTGLGREKWFRLLSLAHKCAWRFLRDEADAAGVWLIDEGAIEFHVGVAISIDELLAAVNKGGVERVRRLPGDHLYMPGYIAEHCGSEGLSWNCKPHRPIILRLKELGLWDEFQQRVTKALGNPSGEFPEGIDTPQEKEKEKEQEKEKEKTGGSGGKKPQLVWVHAKDVVDFELGPNVPPYSALSQKQYADWQEEHRNGRKRAPPSVVSIGPEPPKLEAAEGDAA